MKKSKIYLLLILVIGIFSSSSCNEEEKNNNNNMIWDFAPISISFSVEDAAGNDLLNPTIAGNITENDIKVIYKGKEYPKDVDMSETRAILVVFSGLKTYEYEDQYYLSFGEFRRDGNHAKSFVIDWGDGTTDEILFIHEFEWDNNDPKSSTEVFLNNKKMENRFTIIK